MNGGGDLVVSSMSPHCKQNLEARLWFDVDEFSGIDQRSFKVHVPPSFENATETDELTAMPADGARTP